MRQNAHSSQPRLTPVDVAERLGVAVGTLANWRSQGRGPKWLSVEGAIRYRSEDIEEYERSRFKSAAIVTARRIRRFNKK